MKNKILSMLLWTWGGTVYFFLEVIYKTIRGRPEQISWTMLLVALILCIPVERCGSECEWYTPLPIQALGCTVLVTIVEYCAGMVLNVWLGLNIWDYSNIPLNFHGQICVPFMVLWYVLCLVFIVVFDWLRYWVAGGQRPVYFMNKKGASLYIKNSLKYTKEK